MIHTRALRSMWIAPKTACGKLFAQLPRAHRVTDDPEIAPTCPECSSSVYVRLDFAEKWSGVLKLLGRDILVDSGTVCLTGSFSHAGAKLGTTLLVQVQRKVWDAQDAHPAVRMVLADRNGVELGGYEPSFVG